MNLFRQSNSQDTILAQNIGMSLDTWNTKLNNNIALVGASGKGKTRNFFKPNIMQMNCNYVISDPKGVLIREVGTMLKQNGYKIKVLNLLDMKYSSNYNPFCYIKKESDVYTLIDFLFANVANGESVHGDPFWDLSAKALLSSICLLLVTSFPPEERNFPMVMKLLSMHKCDETDPSSKSDLDILFDIIERRKPENVAVKQYKIYKSCGGGRTAQSILINAQIYLQHFNLPEYENLTWTDNLELERISKEKTALFLVVPDTDSSKDWLAGIFYSQLFDILCNQENPIHVRFFLDDFACTGKIPDFQRKLSMIRSRNLSCVICVQDEAQLEYLYGKAAKEIISNCDSYVFLGSTNIDSCEIAARRLSDGKATGATIRNMDENNCVVVYGNKGGIYKKYDIKKHPRYKEIADERYSPMMYNLELYHMVDMPQKREESEELTQGLMLGDGEVCVKNEFYDSQEEKYLATILSQITNLNVYPHQHLRDIFSVEDKYISKKIAKMHCDFVVRGNDMKVLFAIEVDGKQHQTNPGQIVNDELKDTLFESNNIPLLRISAECVREAVNEVISKVVSVASVCDRECSLLEESDKYAFVGEIPPFQTEKSCEMVFEIDDGEYRQ